MALHGYTWDFLQTVNFYSKISRIHLEKVKFLRQTERMWGPISVAYTP
jgi:hypothetical protein